MAAVSGRSGRLRLARLWLRSRARRLRERKRRLRRRLKPVEEASEMALPLTLAAAPEDLTVWEVDPARQRTVRGVVEAWADRAEWKLAWQADQDFSVAAEASLRGRFFGSG